MFVVASRRRGLGCVGRASRGSATYGYIHGYVATHRLPAWIFATMPSSEQQQSRAASHVVCKRPAGNMAPGFRIAHKRPAAASMGFAAEHMHKRPAASSEHVRAAVLQTPSSASQEFVANALYMNDYDNQSPALLLFLDGPHKGAAWNFEWMDTIEAEPGIFEAVSRKDSRFDVYKIHYSLYSKAPDSDDDDVLELVRSTGEKVEGKLLRQPMVVKRMPKDEAIAVMSQYGAPHAAMESEAETLDGPDDDDVKEESRVQNELEDEVRVKRERDEEAADERPKRRRKRRLDWEQLDEDDSRIQYIKAQDLNIGKW